MYLHIPENLHCKPFMRNIGRMQGDGSSVQKTLKYRDGFHIRIGAQCDAKFVAFPQIRQKVVKKDQSRIVLGDILEQFLGGMKIYKSPDGRGEVLRQPGDYRLRQTYSNKVFFSHAYHYTISACICKASAFLLPGMPLTNVRGVIIRSKKCLLLEQKHL